MLSRSFFTAFVACLILNMLGSVPLVQGADKQYGKHRRSRFAFAFIGDFPYDDIQVRKLDGLIEEVNADRTIKWVVHAGDIKGGSAPCDDATFVARFEQFQKFKRPFILTPGDNDWTDCHRVNSGQFNPVERLEKLREIFYPRPGFTTGGKSLPVETQASNQRFGKYVENVLWQRGGVVFAAVHVVGSRNNLAPWAGIDPKDSLVNPRPDRLAEFEARQVAALHWLEHIFGTAGEINSPGVFITIHGNPRFELKSEEDGRAGFNQFLEKLAVLTAEFGKPVVLSHGDFHFFLIDKHLRSMTSDGELRRLENFTRIQSFGNPDVHWVKVSVDTGNPNVFNFEQKIVEGSKFAR